MRFGWVHTTCARCGSLGLIVCVPLGHDGKPNAVSFESLCSWCHMRPEIRAEHEEIERKAFCE